MKLSHLFPSFAVFLPIASATMSYGAEGFICQSLDGNIQVQVKSIPVREVDQGGTKCFCDAEATIKVGGQVSTYIGQLSDHVTFDPTYGDYSDRDEFSFARDRWGRTPTVSIDFLQEKNDVPGMTHGGFFWSADELFPEFGRYSDLRCRSVP